jgi:hypothetical protein
MIYSGPMGKSVSAETFYGGVTMLGWLFIKL